MSAILERRYRILVIDDNTVIHEDFQKVLCPSLQVSDDLRALSSKVLGTAEPAIKKSLNYRLSFADRGQTGYALVEEALKNQEPFDLAFVDMRMPNGWNGMETIQAIWKIQPDLPIVLCTAYSDVSWEKIQSELDHLDRFFVLKKPFDTIEVQQLTDALIKRQLAENELKKNQAILETAQAIAKIGHYTLNAKTGEVIRSKTLEHILGIRSNFEQRMEAWFDLIDVKDRKKLLEAIARSRKTEEQFECVCKLTRWSDQEPRWIVASGYWQANPYQAPFQLIGTIQDITERYQLQDHLNLLQRCISELDDVIIIVDQPSHVQNNLRVVFVNQAFTDKTGYRSEDVIGKAPLFINPTAKSQAQEVKRLRHAITHHEATRIELVMHKKNGDDYWVDLSLTPVHSRDERFWIAVLRAPSTSGVLNAIETVTQGATWVNEKATKKILSRMATLTSSALTPEQHRLSLLSPKELEVAQLILDYPDSTRKELSEKINISEHTLRNHLASIYEKLNVRNQLECYVFCKEHLPPNH